MHYTRIKAPKFKVGKYVLNEYELRQLQLEVAQGKREGNIMVKEGNSYHLIKSDGKFDVTPLGYAVNSKRVLEMIRLTT